MGGLSLSHIARSLFVFLVHCHTHPHTHTHAHTGRRVAALNRAPTGEGELRSGARGSRWSTLTARSTPSWTRPEMRVGNRTKGFFEVANVNNDIKCGKKKVRCSPAIHILLAERPSPPGGSSHGPRTTTLNYESGQRHRFCAKKAVGCAECFFFFLVVVVAVFTIHVVRCLVGPNPMISITAVFRSHIYVVSH